MSAQALSASRLRPPGLAETVRFRVFYPFNENKLTSFPNERRTAREVFVLSNAENRTLLYLPLICPRPMVTWCSAMAVKSGITCNALDWWSHHKMWTGFVGLVYNCLTITKPELVVLVLVYYQDYFIMSNSTVVLPLYTCNIISITKTIFFKVQVGKVSQVDTIC